MPIDVESNHVVLNSKGEIDEVDLQRATDDILKLQCNKFLSCDDYIDGQTDEVNQTIVKYVLDNTFRTSDGKLVMPLIWREDLSQFLSNNANLAKRILSLKKRPSDKLLMMDDCICEWKQCGIIERIYNFQSFVTTGTTYSVLPHMGVSRLERETTKCRIVFLSNLSEQSSNGKLSLSHNQAMYPGHNLNQKLTTAVMQLRFGEKLICYD
jgi:hypothetical protein